MNINGVEVLNSIRSTIMANGSAIDYGDRIPEATQDNLKDIGKALFSYEPAMNQFLNELINRIGMVYVHDKLYNNKLKFLKRGYLEYGDSIEEIFVDLAKAIHFVPAPATGNECDVYKQYKPEIVSAFHRVNREDTYPITINEEMLKRAFTGYQAFSSFVAGIFNSVYRADEVDEYILFKQLLGETLSNSYLVQVTKPTDKTTSEAFSIAMRANGLALEYVSRKYNSAGVATNTDLSEQILILRSDIVPVIDVTQLANNFNLNLAQPISGRIIVIDDFGQGNDNIIGGIIDRDFSMIYDTVYKTESIYNPRHLYWNYFLHHHQIIASSPFANAIGFTTETITPKIEDLTVLPATQSIAKGYSNSVRTVVDFVGDIDTSVTYSIATATSDDTRVTESGEVFIGADETASTLTVTATSVANSGKTATATINVIEIPSE